MLTRTYSNASRTNFETQPSFAPVPAGQSRLRAWGTQLWPGLSLVLLAAATAWVASAHLLEGWQFR